jgi:hypothetical protein
MSIALRYLSFEEVSLLCERLSGVCRQLGVKDGDDLDRIVDSGLTAMMIQLEAYRAAQSDRKTKLKLI